MNEMESKNLINVGDRVEMEAKTYKYSNKQIHHIDIYLGLVTNCIKDSFLETYIYTKQLVRDMGREADYCKRYGKKACNCGIRKSSACTHR